MSHENPYVHGTEPDEQDRLSALNDILNDASVRSMDLRPGIRILDVGSGLGQLTRAMGRIAGPGCVLGIERSEDQISEARRKAKGDGEAALVEFRQGDAVELPLSDEERGTFDVVHTRFLLEHVTDPQAVVNAMVDAVRPGGSVILEDDDHDVLRLWPAAPGFERLWRAYIQMYRELGCDPFVGRRLVELLLNAGATPARNLWPFFGGCAGGRMFPVLIDNFVGIVEGARETIVRVTELDDASISEAVQAFREWGDRPDAAMWYGTFWAEGRKPELQP